MTDQFSWSHRVSHIQVHMYNQALTDVRLTGAGTKCLYCICLFSFFDLWEPITYMRVFSTIDY